MTLDEALRVCGEWFNHLERREEDTRKLQIAASLARKGEVEEAQKLKNSVDSTPRVYDGARLEPAVKRLIEEIETYDHTT